MTTGQTVYELAITLMDSLNETTGEADYGDNSSYKYRTVGIINILMGELYPYSDTYRSSDGGKRPVATPIDSLTEYIDLDDSICRSVLPYGLAAHLLLQEDQSAASYFNQKYEEGKQRLSRGIPQESVDIEDVYGGMEYLDFGRW